MTTTPLTHTASLAAPEGPPPAAHTPRRWPLLLIAAPAAVAVWSGWVGLGTLCGFGIVHPLPGIVDGFRLNTAITLPVGVEAYGAYALGAWLIPSAAPAPVVMLVSCLPVLTLGFGGALTHLLRTGHLGGRVAATEPDTAADEP